MTSDEAQQIALIVRHVDDRDEILDGLAAAFPEHDWRDLVLLTCPNCGRRQEYLYNARWCYECRPEDQRPVGMKLSEMNEVTRAIFVTNNNLFAASPLLKYLRRR